MVRSGNSGNPRWSER